MELRIYQIDTEQDITHVKFQPLDSLTQPINPSIYKEVFRGDVDCDDLEQVYRKFNTEGHPLFYGHSLSVSDVVVNADGAYFCDTVGWKKVDFDERNALRSANLMRVVYVEPHKPAYEADVDKTLHGIQKAVQGYMELLYNGDGTYIVCNEEAKLKGMSGNRRIGDGTSIIAGPFFLCGEKGDDFCDLTEEQTDRYLTRFAQPEEISDEEVQQDMKMHFFVF